PPVNPPPPSTSAVLERRLRRRAPVFDACDRCLAALASRSTTLPMRLRIVGGRPDPGRTATFGPGPCCVHCASSDRFRPALHARRARGGRRLPRGPSPPADAPAGRPRDRNGRLRTVRARLGDLRLAPGGHAART